MFNFDFHQFRDDPKSDYLGPNHYVSNPWDILLTPPYLGSNSFVSNQDDAIPLFKTYRLDSINIAALQPGSMAQNTALVPEPALLLLFGVGTIVFAGYLRKNYKK